MYILKNAILSIKRNKGRNILIGIIITVIACFLTVSLAIKNTSSSLIEAYENANDTVATIVFNRENMMNNFKPSNEDNFENMKEEFNKIESLSIEDIKEYGNSKYLKNYYYIASINIDTDLEAASSNFSFKKDNDNGRFGNRGNLTDFTLTGYSTTQAMEEFIKGKYTITDSKDDLWEKILDGKYCLVNSELATLNEINIGDTIKIKNNNEEIEELEVVGIFKESNNDNNNEMSMFSSSANTLITNSKIIEDLITENADLKVNVTPYFTLNNKDEIDEFTSELQELGLNENYTLQTNESEIASATSSVKNVSNFATTFLIITIIIGIVVLCILNLINIRERKYEIGVLRTIGMKKSSVALEFILELTIISLVGLILGASLGAGISKPIGNSLLASEIKSSNENKEQLENNFGGPNFANNNKGNNRPDSFNKINGVVNIEEFNSIDAVVNTTVIIELMGICLLLVIISSSCAVLNIVRFRPLSILKERT